MNPTNNNTNDLELVDTDLQRNLLEKVGCKTDFDDFQRNVQNIQESQSQISKNQNPFPTNTNTTTNTYQFPTNIFNEQKINNNQFSQSDFQKSKDKKLNYEFEVNKTPTNTFFGNSDEQKPNPSRKNSETLATNAMPSHQKTQTDIINDYQGGEPTASDVILSNKKNQIEKSKKRVQKMLAGKKKKKLDESQQQSREFLEDQFGTKQSDNLADMIFFRKNSPSTNQKKIRGKRCAPKKWADKENRLFFKGLEMFGMDFSLMETLFANRNRKQLLRKFHKEKKRNPNEVENALNKHGNDPKSKLVHYGLLKGAQQDLFNQKNLEKSEDDRKLGNKAVEMSIEQFDVKSNSSLDSVDQVSFC